VKARISFIVLGLLLTTGSQALAGSWTDAVKLAGDFRYRHEFIKVGDDEARNRQRIGSHIAVQAKVNETTTLSLRLATGATDPRSVMQSLDGGFSHKNWMLDIAYFDCALASPAGIHIQAGKMIYPFETTSLIWDSDVTPEGVAVKYSGRPGHFSPVLNLAGFWVAERASDDDSYLLAGQCGAGIKPTQGPLEFRLLGGIFNYTEAEGRPTFYDSQSGWGNSVDTSGHYAVQFNQAELLAQLGTLIGNLPVKIFLNYVTNAGADSLNQGFLAGFSVGKAKEPHSWEVKYDYRRLEKDAIVGAFTDADPWGGGADGNCNKFQAAYQLTTGLQFALSYFVSKKGLVDGTDYQKLHADVNLGF
jgi:hypothetical protein